MKKFKWLLIIPPMVAGTFAPWQFQIVAMTALLMGYASCNSLKWLNFQLLLAYLYGGLATGLGLKILIMNAGHHQFILMLIQPLLVWLVLRIFFYAVETHFTLLPNAVVSQMRSEDEVITNVQHPWQAPERKGASAWSGNTSGKADVPDEHGSHLYYDFYCVGEIAMGGPTYGDVVFSNQCAFTGVGPSIALSEDGHYAAMTLPSRNEWGLLLIDLQTKKAYQPKENSGFWEIDSFKNGIVLGRFSPLTSNAKREATIQELIDASDVLPLVQDDGWWVLDYPEREPFPTYDVATIKSSQGAHKVMFVPDLKSHEKNPFARTQHPKYIVMIDDVLLGMEVNYPHAVWVDGEPNSHLQDGRFLVVGQNIFDFRDDLHDEFDVKHPVKLTIESLDEMTNVSLGGFRDAANGIMSANGVVLPRSTDFRVADYEYYSTYYPSDEDEVEYWDAQGELLTQKRTQVERHMQYLVDLPKFSQEQSMRLCTEVQIVNRANINNSAKLNPVSGKNVGAHYSAYTLTTSCGIRLQDVTHEAIWSQCGRYLAVVLFDAPQKVPYRIAIIDFETATIRELPENYALPSFIWFDKNMLEFSYLIGVNETITYGMGKESTKTKKRIADTEYMDKPYELLIGGILARVKELEQIAEDQKTGKGWAGASVNKVSRHIILFAPNFDKPVLQPPVEIKAS